VIIEKHHVDVIVRDASIVEYGGRSPWLRSRALRLDDASGIQAPPIPPAMMYMWSEVGGALGGDDQRCSAIGFQAAVKEPHRSEIIREF
jgi:hypothetical protein